MGTRPFGYRTFLVDALWKMAAGAMRKHHPKNERIKRQYLAYLEEAKRLSAASVDQVAAAIGSLKAQPAIVILPPSILSKRANLNAILAS